MADESARETQRVLYQASLLLRLAEQGDTAQQHACEAGGLALIARGLAGLVAELAAPRVLPGRHWTESLAALPETLQERRLLERALLQADGELHPLYLRLEQQHRGGFMPNPPQLIAHSAAVHASLRQQLALLQRLMASLREMAQSY